MGCSDKLSLRAKKREEVYEIFHFEFLTFCLLWFVVMVIDSFRTIFLSGDVKERERERVMER